MDLIIEMTKLNITTSRERKWARQKKVFRAQLQADRK